VIGVSTADQVLERFQTFVRESSEQLQGVTATWGERHRLAVEGPPRPDRGADACDPGELEAALHLSESKAGQVINSLATSMREARACVVLAPELYQPLALFGEVQSPQADDSAVQTSLLIELAELLPTLERVQVLLDRVATLAEHLMRQLAAIFDGVERRKDTFARTLRKSSFRPVLDMLGKLLRVPVIVDGLMLENTQFRQAYKSYSWVVSKASARQERVGMLELPPESAAALVEWLQTMEPLALGDTFKLTLNRISEGLQGAGIDLSGSAFRDQLVAYFRTRMEESEASGSAAMDQLELPEECLVPWVCTFVLYGTVWKLGRNDARLVADVLKMHKKTLVVVLYGRVAWCVGEFLRTYLPQLVNGNPTVLKELDGMGDRRRKQAARLDEGALIKEIQDCRVAASGWLAGFSVTLRTLGGGDTGQVLKVAHSTLFSGLTLALRIRACLEEYIVLHLRESVPMPRSCLHYVSLGFQLAKVVEATLNEPHWLELAALLQRHLALEVHKALESSRAKLVRRPTDNDFNSAIDIALGALYRVVDGAQDQLADWCFDVGALALCCTGQESLISSGSGGYWRVLKLSSNWWHEISRLCDTSWCYWVRELLPELLTTAMAQPRRTTGLPRLCRAFAAPLDSLMPTGSRLRSAYLQEMRNAINNCMIEPSCQKIEQDLRLHVHAVMEKKPELVPVAPDPCIIALLRLRPLCLAPSAIIDLKDQIERRLSSTFYNLTALSPHLAEAYMRMRSLAQDRYGLDIVDGRLPAGSLDHGLDVIEIMRNINVFAAQFGYSLHQQLFAQAANQGTRKVRMITIEHLAGSIRTHGIGVINTTVNYAYGFIKRKLEVVVEFLSDESVKSRLMADARWVEERHQTGARQGGALYTWNRALETAAVLRRLGTAGDGVPFLDKLRQVVTQIGNALGYVRAVRSAGMRTASNSLPYAQKAMARHRDLKLETSEDAGPEAAGPFARAAQGVELPPTVSEAVQVADEAVISVTQCFEESTDYLHLLAETFSEALAPMRENSGVATLFHLLLPTLTLSFIDALLVGQEALAKRAITAATSLRSNALSFDDGFAVGVACVLRIFGFEREFHALHWFEAVVGDEKNPMSALPVGGGAPVAEMTSGGQPTATRVQMLKREMKVLAQTLEAASSLFGAPKREAAPVAQGDEDDEDDGNDESGDQQKGEE